MWWTMNCHYNAVYDVQRMNVSSKLGDAAVDARYDGDKQERFAFVRDNPDLVAQMIALRTELLMRMVMPAIVPHSAEAPFMAMARFETGPGGNPHHHGFSVGTPGPRVQRVKADVEGEGDEGPQTVKLDVLTVLRAVRREWPVEDQWSRAQVEDWVSRALARDDAEHAAMAKQEIGDVDGDLGGSESSGGEEPGVEGVEGAGVARGGMCGRVSGVVKELIERGEVEEVFPEGCEGRSDVQFRRVPPVEKAMRLAEGEKRGRGHPVGEPRAYREEHSVAAVEELGVLREAEGETQLQSDLERAFAKFFEDVVSEWNPCFRKKAVGATGGMRTSVRMTWTSILLVSRSCRQKRRRCVTLRAIVRSD